MGSLNTIEDLKTRESFHKWFSEIEDTLFEDLLSSQVESDEENDDDEIPISLKQRIERVKKYISHSSDSDILLELAEDTRQNSNFVTEHNPLEAFATLGSIAFFTSYVHRNASPHAISPHLQEVTNFVQKYKDLQSAKQEYIDGMETVLDALIEFCQLSDSSTIPLRARVVQVTPCKENETNATIFGIKLHFLQGFPNPIFPKISQTLAQILSIDTTNSEWNLLEYNVNKNFRVYTMLAQEEYRKPKFAELTDEMLALEAASQKSQLGQDPRLLLAKCQFLCDFLICNGPSDLNFADMEFDTHSKIVEFIKTSSETITQDHPSFVRANFSFAEIFATELPITRQDRDYAKSLLMKSLEGNPTSSKIHHKMGLFLIKGRQFFEAETYIKRAIELDPHSPEAYHSLVKLLLRDPKMNKDKLESFFNISFPEVGKLLGLEQESILSFWKGCYLFKSGESEPAINVWTETILEFYAEKPELDLESVLPFNTLSKVSKNFLWTKSNLTLEAIAAAVKTVGSQEKTKRRVVFHRLQDLVSDAMKG